jgi:DNA-binding CsgD family transcriptional regulator/tetratricopeptide (TPR) repeat protein
VTNAPLVSRDAELARLLTALDSAATTHGRMVMLAGEPGVGKTRLAHELLVRSERRGFRRVVGRCFEQYATVPFVAWSEALASALAKASPALRAQAKARWPELAQLVPEFGEAPDLSREGGQLRMFRAVTAFLKALAVEQPVVLLLEDRHWADSATLGLLLYLGRHLQDGLLLVVATYRDVEVGPQHPLEETLRELVRERMVDEIVLRDLPPVGAAALMCACLGVDHLADDLVQLVYARTAGNPFFVEEVLKALVEQGALRKVDGQWQRKAIADVEVPRSVRSVVGQRVGRLTHPAQETLRVASALGEEFALDELQRVSDQTEADVLDNLDAALEAKLIVERPAGTAERYAFAHALIQHTLYAQLPSHRLRRLHQRVGEALQALRGVRAVPAAELARHFRLAGEPDRALRYSLLAADYAVLRFAHAEAAQHYAVAVQFALDAGDEVLGGHVREKLAQELNDANRVVEALLALDEALDTYRRLADRAGQARVHYLRARVHHLHFDFRAADALLEEALRLWPREQQTTVEFAATLLDAARVKSFTADYVAARGFAERGLDLCERLGDAGLLARALAEVELVRQLDPDATYSELESLLDRAEELARAARQWRTVGRVHMNRGSRKQSYGDLLGSCRERQQCVSAWERSGVVWITAWGAFVLATVCIALGDWDAARAALRKTRENEPHFPGLDVLDAWLAGEHRRALALIPGWVEDARRRKDAQGVQAALLMQSDCALQLGELALAELAGREAVRVPTTEFSVSQAARVMLAEVVVARSVPDAEVVLAEAEHGANHPAVESERPQFLRAQGLWFQAHGDLAAARRYLLASASAARSQSALVQLARTLAVLVGVARSLGEQSAAEAAGIELEGILHRVGPAARGLTWTAGRAPAVPDAAVGSLTPRELEVATLVARGLTNRQIARALVVTERTVAAHVEHIFAKLGFSSRTQLGVWAAERRLGEASTS